MESNSWQFIESLYQDYIHNSHRIDPSWKAYFQNLENPSHPFLDQAATAEFLRNYGYLYASISPFQIFSFEEPLFIKKEKLRPAPSPLQKIYADKVGFEFKHASSSITSWLEKKIESASFWESLSLQLKKSILTDLIRAESFEAFLHKKYPGEKRFSLQGAETLIPMLRSLLQQTFLEKIKEVLLGMSHRGRLNVITHVLQKPYEEIFAEFEEKVEIISTIEGDVKYHRGYATQLQNTEKTSCIKIILSPNPSHLESIDPIIEGMTRGKQTAKNTPLLFQQFLPILVHGDASLAGQGVVYETLQLSQIEGFKTGGTLHFIIDNHIGFTATPQESRSTPYCSDIAKAFGCPIFHVSAEDPENCIRITLLSLELRQRFGCDVFIRMSCYRKYGHNEGDEPSFTQPLEYALIKEKPSIATLYSEQLISEKCLSQEDYRLIEINSSQVLNEAAQKNGSSPIFNNALQQKPHPIAAPLLSENKLKGILQKTIRIPDDFEIHPKMRRILEERVRKAETGLEIDWATAEILAYGSLLEEGISIRLTGQDVKRGTFSHRHAVWYDQKQGKEYCPLQHLTEEQGRFDIFNSPLSELAVLGFEYGYSVSCPHSLTIWEAQFGDFYNGAQVIIDQYIASAELKWGQTSGITLFLPHGYEGQGPEHSSGRIERFLSLTEQDNMQIVIPTTPGQHFHLLYRQAYHNFQKPLIIFTPKSLLRHPLCTSPLEAFYKGTFEKILIHASHPLKIKTVVFCSGKIYYDFLSKKEELQREDMALIRIEQLYPLPITDLQKAISEYKNAQEYIWTQEEPQNMGCWPYIFAFQERFLDKKNSLKYVGRPPKATTATGFHKKHMQEHLSILKALFHHER